MAINATSAAKLTPSDTTATIYNVSATTAGTEYSQALPANCKYFLLRARTPAKIQLAYTSGATNTTYVTIPPYASFDDKQYYTTQTVYFQTNQNNTIIEIVAYT